MKTATRTTPKAPQPWHTVEAHPERWALVETIHTAPFLSRAQQKHFPDLTGDRDDLDSLRRALSAVYLQLRENHEDQPTAASTSSVDGSAHLLSRVLVATGDTENVETARAMVDALTVPMMAEQFVERWANREGLLWYLDSSAICAVADSVRDWVADGGELGQAPMGAWVAPYVAVAR